MLSFAERFRVFTKSCKGGEEENRAFREAGFAYKAPSMKTKLLQGALESRKQNQFHFRPDKNRVFESTQLIL